MPDTPTTPRRRLLVVLESPYAGDVERNVEYARRALRDSLHHGEAPIASHLLYTQEGVLRDDVPEERFAGIQAGHAWLPVAQLVVVYSDYGVTPGMRVGIDVANSYAIPVEYRYIGKNHEALNARAHARGRA